MKKIILIGMLVLGTAGYAWGATKNYEQTHKDWVSDLTILETGQPMASVYNWS